ncbi:hypothetical protein FU139_24020 [Burkholderia territorii]|nr:hypothetical protein FU139_24020 [Burkholderia territorii]
MPGNGRESGHRVRGCGISGDRVARIVRHRGQICAIATPPTFHRMKGSGTTNASHTCNALIQRDNLYHNTI